MYGMEHPHDDFNLLTFKVQLIKVRSTSLFVGVSTRRVEGLFCAGEHGWGLDVCTGFIHWKREWKNAELKLEEGDTLVVKVNIKAKEIMFRDDKTDFRVAFTMDTFST